MTTAIDTNVLVALWNDDDALNLPAQRALDEVRSRGALVVSAPVYAELLAEPQRDEKFVDRFFAEARIVVDWAFSEAIWREVGTAYQGYATRPRRRGGTEANSGGFFDWGTCVGTWIQIPDTG